MKRPDALLALVAAAVVGLAVMAGFAVELANTQAKSKQDVEARVHERAVLAGALIDSLFSASSSDSVLIDAKLYGTPVVSVAKLNASQQGSRYLAVITPSGTVLAASRGFTAQARAGLLTDSGVLPLLRAGNHFALGNTVAYGRSSVLDFALPFPTRYGERILVSGFKPVTLSSFIDGELRKIPGVAGAHNYLVDGNDTVIASTNPRIPAGHIFGLPAQRAALARSSGDVDGQYYDQVVLDGSTWSVLLAAPDGPLFASISGVHKWVPWLIFFMLAIVGLAALALGRRLLRASDESRDANRQLARLNAELARSNAALEQRATELARSNAELEHFASIASHDLQEPLRKVRTFTERVTEMEADRLSEKGNDYLVRAGNAAERMQSLIEDLLRYSRVATHGREFEEVDLALVTGEVLEDLEAQVESVGAEVHVGALPTVTGDPFQLRQLMQNLISNALKFHRPDVGPEVWVDGERDGEGDAATITVRDNGIGFEPQYSRRIFRVFERLHGRSEYPGTGIGLALCRKIAERHGGDVVADGDPGVGATFTVTLGRHPVAPGILPDRDEADDTERAATHVGV